MFKQNVIKVYILIFASISVMCGCKKNKAEITDLSNIPVAIKFDIPSNSILGDKISPEKERRVYRKVTEMYSELSKVSLVHFKSFHDTLGYYEYSAQSKNGNVLIFIFESAHTVTISGFRSDVMFTKETRFKLINNGLEIYKRAFERTQHTVSIFFHTNDKSISFNRDDGFSVW